MFRLFNRGKITIIYISTSGYSYQDWIGAFYPKGMRTEQMLTYFAREFPFAEINFTYYHLPTESNFISMISKVPLGYRFTVKANRETTHGFDYRTATRRLKQALNPLLQEKQLIGVLAQFPYSFHRNLENECRLQEIHDIIYPIHLFVEFRNAEWLNERTFALLKGRGISFVCVDEPALPKLLPSEIVVTHPVAYVRFHGRNKENWWVDGAGFQRYDYCYSENELKEWLHNMRLLEAKCREVYVSFNNHYRGQAVLNARMFRGILERDGMKTFGPENEQGSLF